MAKEFGSRVVAAGGKTQEIRAPQDAKDFVPYLQKIDPDWTRAKGFDTFAPTGPFISSKCPTRVTTRLNGKVVQEAPLSDRVFDDAALVEYISSIMALEPGDIIATGTPSGISPMKHGDIVEVELDGIGRLRNQVV